MSEATLIKNYLQKLIEQMEHGEKAVTEVAKLSQEVYDALDQKTSGDLNLYKQLIAKLKG